MAKRRLTILFLSAVIVCGASLPAMAQQFQPFGSLETEYDLQPFAPVEFNEFGDGRQPNVGLFFTYDRMNLNVTRPQRAKAPWAGDWTWGNRIDAGYMTEDDHGWLFELFTIDGPNVHQNPTSMTNNPPGPIENVLDLTSVELMKQWRFKPLHHGSIVEVFVGARYIDARHQDNLPLYRVPGADPDIVQGSVVINQIIGPQAGLRWYKTKDRITISAEGRYFYGYNDQWMASGNNGLSMATLQEQDWVPVGDVRLEATCDVTKSFALSVGWDLLYLGKGFGRGFPPFNDQDVLATGVTFGFKVNR